MSIGERIANLRKEKGLTQSKLAKLAGLSASTIAMYETNRRTPDEIGLEKLSIALDTKADVITGNTAQGSSVEQPTTDESKSRKAQKPQKHATAEASEKRSAGTQNVAAHIGKQPAENGESDRSQPSDSLAQELHDILSQEERSALGAPTQAGAEASAKEGALSTLALTREEARIILFLRMYPDCISFIESYITAEPGKRNQLEKTWRLIREFQV